MKPVKLLQFTAEERKILVDAIPFIRAKGSYWWDQEGFKELYKKWIGIPNNPYSENGFDGFAQAVVQMRKAMPLTYKNAQGGYEMKAEYSDMDWVIKYK